MFTASVTGTSKLARPWRRGFSVSVATMSVAAMSVAGCGGGNSPGAATGSQTIGGGDCSQPTKVNLAVQGNIIPTNIVLIAKEKGFYDKYNVKVETTLTKASANAVAGMIGGSIDIAVVGFDFVTANEKGADSITLMATSNTGLWTYGVSKDIKSFADLKGKRIAVSGEQTMSAVALRQAVEQAGVDFKSLTLVPAGSTPDRYAALKAGQVDAASLGAPYTEQAAKEGFNTLGLADEGATPPPLTSGLFVAQKEWASKNEQTVTCFLAGALDTVRWAHDPANIDELATVGAKIMGGGDVALIKEAWQKMLASKRQLPEDGLVEKEAALNAAQAFIDFGVMKKLPDMSKLVNNSYVEKAAKLVKK